MKFASQQEFGRFLLLDPIHEGPESVLFRAQDRMAQRLVALRIIDLNRLDNQGAERMARCRRDINTVARLDDPGLVPVYEVGDAGAMPFVATALCDGPSLSASLLRSRRPDAAFAVRLVLDIARTLARVHERGVYHGNLKLSNLVRHRGRYRITDFGIVHFRIPSPVQAGGARARGPWAPEQREGFPGDARTDVYWLGGVLYRLFTGVRPGLSSGDQHNILHSTADPSFAGRDVPPAVQQIIRMCLAERPERRPRDCLEMSRLLEKALSEDVSGGSGQGAGHSPRVVVFSPPAKRGRIVARQGSRNGTGRKPPPALGRLQDGEDTERLRRRVERDGPESREPASRHRTSLHSGGWPVVPGAIGPDGAVVAEELGVAPGGEALERSLSDRPVTVPRQAGAPESIRPPLAEIRQDMPAVRGRGGDTNTVAIVAAVVIAIVVSASYWLSFRQHPGSGGWSGADTPRTGTPLPGQQQAGALPGLNAPRIGSGRALSSATTGGVPAVLATPTIEELRIHGPGWGASNSSPGGGDAAGVLASGEDGGGRAGSGYIKRKRNSVSPTPMVSPPSSLTR